MEDIDFVITWVDGSDPAWRSERQKYACREGDQQEVRFRDWGLLRYWFRGVAQYAPWVRKIHFVTWGHVPDWLDDGNPKLHIVRHSDFIPPEYLPTFNSHTIELNLHRIPGLAEQFVYFNDDVFLTKPSSPTLFFQHGLPCDCFGLDSIYFSSNSIGRISSSGIAVLNDAFLLHDVLSKHWKKVFSIRNGFKKVLKTVFFSKCYPWFPGLFHWHLSFSFQKTTFLTVWAEIEKELDATCRSKFREANNLGPTVMKYWQLACGAFTPTNTKNGYYIQLTDQRIDEACACITSAKYNLLCLNDVDGCKNVELAKQKLQNAFEAAYPICSSFEKIT